MSNKRKGAKKGGRVHWLLLELYPEFKRNFDVYYNYALHRYVFINKEKHTIKHIFIVVRTSKRCFRVMYTNMSTYYIDYFSNTKSRLLARWMWTTWKLQSNVDIFDSS